MLKHSPSIYLLGSRLEKASDNHLPLRQNARMEKLDEALLMDMPSYSFLICHSSCHRSKATKMTQTRTIQI
jgi:hypothetical protein